MKYAHVRTEAVLPSGRGTATRGTLHWEQWNGWQREEKVLAEPSAASLGVQTACMGAACRGVAGRGYRVSTGAWLRTACGFIVDFYHSIWIIISGSALFAHRAFCGYEIRRLFFLLFGMFFGYVVGVACAAFAFALAFYVFAYECGAVIFVACFEAPLSPMRYVLEIIFNAKILNVHSVTVADGHAARYSSAGLQSAFAPPKHEKRKLLFINFVSS